MPAGKPDDYKAIIDAHKHESLAVILADQPDCIRGWQKFAIRGRRYEIPDALGPDGFDPPEKIVAIVMVCPGQDITDAVEWCHKHGIPPLRIRFVLHPDCDDVDVFTPWYLHDDDPVVQYATAYPGKKGAQKALGDWYNDWIYIDATGQDWPLQVGP